MTRLTQLLDPAHKHLIGMVHLMPLPGAPGFTSMDQVVDRAVADATALQAAGFDALMIENFGDLPFTGGSVGPETIAALTVAAGAVGGAVALPTGINVLRNDAAAALGIAAAVGALFIRVNVHTGALLTDQGWITGQAHHTVRARARLAPELAICADVLVKHALAPTGADIQEIARDTVHRGCADIVIVSGSGTGQPTDPDRLERVRQALPDTPVWVGSGFTAAAAPNLLRWADGAVVGSSVKKEGDPRHAVDALRARQLVEAVRAL